MSDSIFPMFLQEISIPDPVIMYFSKNIYLCICLSHLNIETTFLVRFYLRSFDRLMALFAKIGSVNDSLGGLGNLDFHMSYGFFFYNSNNNNMMMSHLYH